MSPFVTVFLIIQVDGRVSFHRLVVAAASPLLRETMSEDPNEEIIISVPEVTSNVMAAMMDLLYKGRMYITPSNTWAIRSLVEVLRINAEDVSVISGSRASINNSPSLPLPSTPITTNDRNDKSTRKRRRESADEAVTPVIAKTPKSKTSKVFFTKRNRKEITLRVVHNLKKKSGNLLSHSVEVTELYSRNLLTKIS